MNISAELKNLLQSLQFSEKSFQDMAAVEEFTDEELEDMEYMQDRIETAMDWEELEEDESGFHGAFEEEEAFQ